MPDPEARAERIRDRAISTFGEVEAETWLASTWRVFGNRSPLDMAQDSDLTQAVIAFLDSLCAGDERLDPSVA